ncbi:conserved hypothetical protein [Talaromyces stipitatus ATCC 10500]|uniref:Sulfatase N-terminal domain-containing protein n=1 Tax=Talaromyces stipitatus (strain ATCC 10500 / CBS 375.48 / QM 6759 / NRRL 1006) TaxID=441959 RepID=B8MHX2_TALSN|nr:uncharacterized protein TSTA_015390 [Talaromyces stipitatus ATCC 10500]EED16452.1 conserved hypothetical protein [Talaromyces stipitatus ATCC 10500]
MASRSLFVVPSLIPFTYSLLVVSCLTSKFLHLALHWRSVSLVHFIIFLPTLFFWDILVLVIVDKDRVLTYGASAIQIGFFWETGSQVEWGASSSFLRDPAAMKILFSGTKTQRLEYPFPMLTAPDRWQSPSGYSPGLTPGNHSSLVRPEWLPENPPSGFDRWLTDVQRHERIKNGEKDKPNQCMREHKTYNAVTDSTKISNLQEAVYPVLKDAFNKNAIQIEHIVMLVLESTRKEVFPMKEGSFLYDTIVYSHDEDARDTIIDKLAILTPTAQMLTRDFATNSTGDKMRFDNDDVKWVDRIPLDMGGINVKGALTASSLTLKSLLALHCGVMPLPVDMLEESLLEVYQPCLPHILSLFNTKKLADKGKHANNESQLVRERPWKSVFIQSSTDSYDRQSNLTQQLGFDQNIVKETIEDPSATHYPPKTKVLNYFGYSEDEIESYMKDLVFEAAENKTRLFLSHLTLTTHHPWAYPSTFKDENYFGRDRWNHRDMNSYLNTVRYGDAWLGKILGYLEQAGIANRTLVVIVGDHGQAFDEDDGLQGTFENSHISNFRVPLLFRHAHLPHMDIEANVTTGMNILPTVLDMLVESKSLNEADIEIARSLIHEYQGQSLLRPFISRDDRIRRRVWNIGIINAGGSLVAAMSADLPYRLIVPITRHGHGMNGKRDSETLFEYRFTHTLVDPHEQSPLSQWIFTDLRKAVREEYGEEAEDWIEEARKMVQWWVVEQKRIWNYS